MKQTYSQTDYARVNRLVIEPLKRHYSADFDAQGIDDYISALRRFSESSLDEGMQEVLATCRRRPTIAHIAGACKETTPGRATGNGEWYIVELNAKYAKAHDDAMAFTLRFMDGELGLQAQREGWEQYLRNYVFAQAHLQAHYLAKLNAGYDADALFNYCAMRAGKASDERISARRERELDYAKRQDMLRAEPPADLIAEWKRGKSNAMAA